MFFDLKRQKSFAYVPARDQNHVVRGKKPSDLFVVFYYFKKKGFKDKIQMAKKKFVFFILFLRKGLNILKWIKVFCKENKRGKSLDKNQGFFRKRIPFLFIDLFLII